MTAPLTKVGNLYLRYYFIVGTSLLRQHNLEYKAYYWRKYQEVSKYQQKRALVLTARRLARLVHALLTENVPYSAHQRMIDHSIVKVHLDNLPHVLHSD